MKESEIFGAILREADADLSAMGVTQLPDGRYQQVQQTMQLRWKSGVLEQAYVVSVFDDDGVQLSSKVEWRVVPSED